VKGRQADGSGWFKQNVQQEQNVQQAARLLMGLIRLSLVLKHSRQQAGSLLYVHFNGRANSGSP
jgi:hypothetical protein